MARVVFFAFDIAEAAQLRRIDSLRALGHGVVSVSFRRDNMEAQAAPDWPNLALGPVQQQSLRPAAAAACAGRVAALAAAGDPRRRRRLDRAQSRHAAARRLMRAAGSAGRRRGWSTNASTSTGCSPGDAIGAVMRWVERRMLRAVRSSDPVVAGVPRRYFEPVQQVRRPSRCWRTSSGSRGAAPAPQRPRRGRRPRPSSWAGSGRCAARSLEILAGPRAAGAAGRDPVPRRGASPCPAGFRRRSCARIPTSAMPGPIATPMRSARSTPAAMRSGRRTCGNPGPTATGCCPTGSTRRAISAVRPSRRGDARPGGAWRRTGWASRCEEPTAEALTELLRGLDAGGNPRGVGPAPGAPRLGFPADRSGACRRAGAGPGGHRLDVRAMCGESSSLRGVSRAESAMSPAPGFRKPPIKCAVCPLLRPLRSKGPQDARIPCEISNIQMACRQRATRYVVPRAPRP
jgi:hypothetical protein